MEEKVNLNIGDGDAFYAHELSINFNPMQFIFDFKSITPRVDPRSQTRASIALKHNVVMVDPYHAKRIFNLLETTIKKYEKEFGTIEEPKALKALKKKKSKEGSSSKIQDNIPSYFG
jgi:hypothetical protein